ncbi:hypothetical protein JJQ93_11150 [Thermoanaerobacterium sp. R66]|nr:hypothetical protein [Thermoanaerobacterium sp. R66]
MKRIWNKKERVAANFMNINLNFKDIRMLKYLLSDDVWIKKLQKIREVFDFYSSVDVLLFESVKEVSIYLGLEIPEWVVGTYFDKTIIMLDYEIWKNKGVGTFGQILLHEFVHVVITKITKNRCPVWLNEGIAMYFAEQQVNIFKKTNEDFYCENIFELTYDNEELYFISAITVDRLIKVYGIETILFRIKNVSNYKEDYILGVDNIKRISYQYCI